MVNHYAGHHEDGHHDDSDHGADYEFNQHSAEKIWILILIMKFVVIIILYEHSMTFREPLKKKYGIIWEFFLYEGEGSPQS